MHPVRFSPLAEDDLREAFEYYTRKKPGLGVEFMLCVRQTVNFIEENPRMFPIVLDDVRRASVKRFPFGVFYVVGPDESIVIAALHAKKDVGFALSRSRILPEF